MSLGKGEITVDSAAGWSCWPVSNTEDGSFDVKASPRNLKLIGCFSADEALRRIGFGFQGGGVDRHDGDEVPGHRGQETIGGGVAIGAEREHYPIRAA